MVFYLPGKEDETTLRLVQCFPGLTETPYDNTVVGFRKDMCENGPFLPYLIDELWHRNFYCSTEESPRDNCVKQQFYRKDSSLSGKTDHTFVSLLLMQPSKSAPVSPPVTKIDACVDITKPKVSVLATRSVISNSFLECNNNRYEERKRGKIYLCLVFQRTKSARGYVGIILSDVGLPPYICKRDYCADRTASTCPLRLK